MEKFCELMFKPKNLSIPALIHGQTYESVATRRFMEETNKVVVKVGLIIDPILPFLAASPDGFVQNEESLIEVKCPYKIRGENPSTSNLDFLEIDDHGKAKLKRTHKYYFQIQGQLCIAKKELCYFIVYTFVNILVVEVSRDEHFFRDLMLPKLKLFYDNYYIDYIISEM